MMPGAVPSLLRLLKFTQADVVSAALKTMSHWCRHDSLAHALLAAGMCLRVIKFMTSPA